MISPRLVKQPRKAPERVRLGLMHRLVVLLALLVSCGAPLPSTAPPAVTPTVAPVAATTVSPVPSPTPAATPTFRDLKVTPAGEARGDHMLVMEIDSSQTAGVPSKVLIWDVPLDSGASRLLVSYTRGPELFISGHDYFSLPRQLSADGRLLVLSDPVDTAATGLVVVDLVAGTARTIRLTVMRSQAAWSPDGERIAFRGGRIVGALHEDAGVWVVSTKGGDERQLVPTADKDGVTYIHGWTEDGKGVVFTQRGTLGVVDVATGAVARIGGLTTGLSPVAVRAKRPSVAIVFDDQAARGTFVGHVEVRDTVAARGRTIAGYGPDEGTFLNEPRWRPGSDEILLFYAFGQGLQLRKELVIVDGVSGARRTVPTPDGVRAVAWSADGRRIVYSDLFEARVRDADGSNDRVLFRPAPSPANENAFVVALAAFAPR